MFRNVLLASITLLGLFGTGAANAAMFEVLSEANKKEAGYQQRGFSGENVTSGVRPSLAIDRAATLTSTFQRGETHASRIGAGDVITLAADGLRYDDLPLMRDGRFFFSVIGTSFDYSSNNERF